MHSTFNRAQNVFGFFTTVASVIMVLIAGVSLVQLRAPALGPGSLVVQDVQVVKGRPAYYSSKKEEYAHITFELDVDLSKLFTWNTKQVFLYITAAYPPASPGAAPTRAVVWDAVLTHPLAPVHNNQYIYPDARAAGAEAKKKAADAAKLKRQTSLKDKSSKGSAKAASKSPKGSAKAAKPKEKTRQEIAAEVQAAAQAAHVPGLLQLRAQKPKYVLTDPSGRIAERANATLELAWNIQPWVGALTWHRVAQPPSAPASSWWHAWRYLDPATARTPPFDLPALKDRSQVAKNGLETERGGEANRGSPA